MSFLNKLGLVTGIDSKSLSVFRIAIGILLFIDLFLKFSIIPDFYLSDGPFSINFHKDLVSKGFSIFSFVKSEPLIYLFFLFSFIIYTLFFIGYKTKHITIIAYFCLWNLQQRLFFTLGWDAYINVLLFWSIFLPLDQHFSYQQYFKRKKVANNYEFKGLPVWLLLSQIGLVYTVNGLVKNGSLWDSGLAIKVALSDFMLNSSLAEQLAHYSTFLSFSTYLVLLFETLFILFLFFPFFNSRIRLVLAFALFCFHFGIVCLIDVGLHSYVGFAVSFLLLPSFFWSLTKKESKIALSKVVYLKLNIPAKVLLIICGVVMLNSNLVRLQKSSKIESILRPIPLFDVDGKKLTKLIGKNTVQRQNWGMFAPNPPQDIGWIVLSGKTEKDIWYDMSDQSLLQNAEPANKFEYPYKHIFSDIRLKAGPQNKVYFEKRYTAWLLLKANKWNIKFPDKKLKYIELSFFSIPISNVNIGQSSIDPKYQTLYGFKLN